MGIGRGFKQANPDAEITLFGGCADARHAAPASCVVVIELHPLEHGFIVPLSKHDDSEPVLCHV